MLYALYAAVLAALLAVIACALSAFFWSRTSALASQVRSMRSMQGELIEIRDYVSKIDAWAKRINMREVMRERHADGKYNGLTRPQSSARATSSAIPLTKDELRARAGIIPGRAAPHTED